MTLLSANPGQPISGVTLSAGDSAAVNSGGLATSVTQDQNSTLFVYSGGVADFTMLSGGFEYVSAGGVTSDTMAVGGNEAVESGGSAVDTVDSGIGGDSVYAGGTALGTEVKGGLEAVYSGGSALFSVVSGGGAQYVYTGGTATGTEVLASGTQNVAAGTATGTVLNGGTQLVVGGIANATSVGSGGLLLVSGGGHASGAVIEAGGTAIASAGGVLSGIQVNPDGFVDVVAGGTAVAPIVRGGGMLILETGGLSGAVSDVTVSVGGTIDLPGLAFVSGGSAVVDGTDLLTVTEGANSATVPLAGNYFEETFEPSKDSLGGTLLTLIQSPRTLVWTGAANLGFAAAGDWNDISNGLTPAVMAPDPGDTAEFLSTGGTITGAGTAAALDFGGGALWNVTSGASLTAETAVTVGQGGSGALLVNAGASLTGLGAVDTVSGAPGTTAAVTVDGAGSTWNSAGELVVGASGGGDVTVSGLASLAAAARNALPAMVLGEAAGGSGTLSVTGAGSRATVTGQLDVGQAGAGRLTVANQATVQTGGSGLAPSQGIDIAALSGGSGQVTVTGAQSLLTNTGEFIVGDAGLGQVSVLAGGTVSTSPGTVAGLAGLVIANTASASGSSLTLSGAGSNLTVTGLLSAGAAGSGSLSLANGATATAGSLDAGVSASAVGQISVIGSGTGLSITGNATVADAGTGVLSILNGATFTATSLTIGDQSGSSGALIVSGAGSVINLSGALNIGTALGVGDLTVGPGAAVHAAVVNLNGQVVLEGGLLDPSVQVISQGQTAGGFGTILADDIIVEGVIQAGGARPDEGLLLVEGTVLGGGKWSENGKAQRSESAAQFAINQGGTLELTGAVLNAATTTFSDDLQNTYTVTKSVVDISFDGNGPGVLTLDDVAGFAGTVASVFQGDDIVVTGGTLSGLGVTNGNTVTVADSGAGARQGGVDTIVFATGVGTELTPDEFSILNGNTVQFVACFAEGTRIGTVDGGVLVERLAVGDRVVLAEGGDAPVVWIGTRAVDCARHPAPETVWPVRVSAGAFGAGVPVRDLWLSPDHAVFVDGVLVPVRLLVNGGTVRQEKRRFVRYFHVELPRHEVILAEGLAVESYLDTGDRGSFSDEGVVRLVPVFGRDVAGVWEMEGAAELVVGGERLVGVRRGISGLGDRRETRATGRGVG